MKQVHWTFYYFYTIFYWKIYIYLLYENNKIALINIVFNQSKKMIESFV